MPFRRRCSVRRHESTPRSWPSSVTSSRPSRMCDPQSRRLSRIVARPPRTRSPSRDSRRGRRVARGAERDGTSGERRAPRSSSRAEFVQLAELLAMSRGDERSPKINLALVVGPAARRRQARGRRPCCSESTSTTRSRSSRRTRWSSTGSPRTRSSAKRYSRLADAAGVAPRWRVRIEKRIPVAAGLGGGSSDAATALQLANASSRCALLVRRAPSHRRAGSALTSRSSCASARSSATGDGTGSRRSSCRPTTGVVLVVPDGDAKESTGKPSTPHSTTRGGADGFEERADSLRLARSRRRGLLAELAGLPRTTSPRRPLAQELMAAGAFRADVSGRGADGVRRSSSRGRRRFGGSRLLDVAGRTLVARPVDAGRSAGTWQDDRSLWGVAKW